MSYIELGRQRALQFDDTVDKEAAGKAKESHPEREERAIRDEDVVFPVLVLSATTAFIIAAADALPEHRGEHDEYGRNDQKSAHGEAKIVCMCSLRAQRYDQSLGGDGTEHDPPHLALVVDQRLAHLVVRVAAPEAHLVVEQDPAKAPNKDDADQHPLHLDRLAKVHLVQLHGQVWVGKGGRRCGRGDGEKGVCGVCGGGAEGWGGR